jgi:predicted  nucleic acid-binding Zn-ribbon protein
MKTLKMVLDSTTAQLSVASSLDWPSFFTAFSLFVNLLGLVGLVSLILNVEGIKKDLGDIKKDLGDVKKDLGDVKKDLGDVKKDLGDVKKVLGDFKKEQTKHLGRLERGTRRGFFHVIKDMKELQRKRKLEQEIDEMFEES